MESPNVYRLRFSEGFEWLLPINDADFESLRFDGQSRVESWRPVKMKRLMATEKGERLRLTDFPACSGGDMLLMSRSARDRIGPRLESYGEILRLECEDGEFWILNVTRLIDALDESKSELVRASDTGAVLMIRKHAFRASELGEALVFKLVQMPRGLIYVTDPFIEIVGVSGLRGLEFVQVWPP
ncbi:MAG: DUF1629 domain-containing protein [Actinomycetota bacterium]